MFGLPAVIRACLFDLDGVLTQTATVHFTAWRETFDEFLRAKAGSGFVPFSLADYLTYVDGKPRRDGVRAFLASRGIHLPEGQPDDPPSAETIAGVGNRKNERLLHRLAVDGVATYEGSVRYVHAVHAAGLRTAVVTASANGEAVVAAAGLAEVIDVRIDGVVAAATGLRGKPAPDTFLAGAERLGLAPGECAVFEDALAGVAAGRAGRFGLVVGVDRAGQADALRHHGADIVVADLSELLADA
jgi:beta-phosphoglucomutase family hydrolase